ncbi:type I-B CRISPR-associated protein Cas5b [Haloimpatiens massiliensis]|uniref:type I-B CRISPR-associated protein Cas5b n=1 Tax=Haloimpatiens massiliensis TaxID=1658110 RepID=UPI000C82E755|nr:type I-B CRISPR-associated protein Cas5b [Haloimpatiens massiliensis]
MNVLKFTLSGKTAFFKKPDVNTYYYFTYGSIHKVALLGILGAINGYGGYNQQEFQKEMVYPEFYEKLKDIKVGIVPKNSNGYISKKIQVFNNSVGYASKEKGGNLIVKEQWLEEPKWDIYILIQGKMEEELADRILNSRFKYIPYLGKNDHVANISNVEMLRDIEKVNNIDEIHSVFIKNDFKMVKVEDDIDDIDSDSEYIQIYKYEERLPIALEEKTNKYDLETFVYTNSKLMCLKETLIYKCDAKVIYFF